MKCLLKTLLGISFFFILEAKKHSIRHAVNKNSNTRIAFYASAGLIIFFTCVGCTYICRKLFPHGPVFNALELDDIRIERLDDIEAGYKKNIDVLKNKLAFHRKKKTNVQTDRDIKVKINERAEMFNAKGRTRFGDAWDAGTVPQRDILAMTQEELVEMKKEIKTITKERKAEEKRDMWAMWEDIDGNNKDKIGKDVYRESPAKKSKTPHRDYPSDDERGGLLDSVQDRKYRILNFDQEGEYGANTTGGGGSATDKYRVLPKGTSSSSHYSTPPSKQQNNNNSINPLHTTTPPRNAREQSPSHYNPNTSSSSSVNYNHNNNNAHNSYTSDLSNNGGSIMSGSVSSQPTYDEYRKNSAEKASRPKTVNNTNNLDYGKLNAAVAEEGSTYSLNLNLPNPYGSSSNSVTSGKHSVGFTAADSKIIKERKNGLAQKQPPALHRGGLERPGTTPEKDSRRQAALDTLKNNYVSTTHFHDTVYAPTTTALSYGSSLEKDTANNGNAYIHSDGSIGSLPPLRGVLNRPYIRPNPPSSNYDTTSASNNSTSQQQYTNNSSNNNGKQSTTSVVKRPPPPPGPPPGYIKQGQSSGQQAAPLLGSSSGSHRVNSSNMAKDE